MQAGRTKGRSLKWLFVALAALALGGGGYLAFSKFTAKAPKSGTKKPSRVLNLIVSDDKVSVFVNGLAAYPGKVFDLSTLSDQLEFMIGTYSKRHTLIIERPEGSMNVWVQLSADENVEGLGKIVFGRDLNGKKVHVNGELVGKAPLVFIGPLDRQWQVQVGEDSEVRTEVTK